MGRLQRSLAAVAAAVVLAAGGCGDDGGGGGSGGDVLSVGEALEHAGDDRVTVEGLVLADASGTYLCSALAESFPPQCGSPAVSLSGFDLASLEDLQEDGPVRWSERPVAVTGRMVAGVLTVDGSPTTVGGGQAND